MKDGVLLFDLDGTLTDPKPGIVGCIRFALDQLAVACPGDVALAGFIGPPLRETFASLMWTAEADPIEKAMALYRLRFAETGLYQNQVYDGVRTMLERAAVSAAAMYVATSKPAIYDDRIVKHFGLAGHFHKVYGPELDGRHDNKAELLAHLLAEERIAPDVAVMIGDRAADVRAAKANGLKSVGVLWGYGSQTELVNAGADILFHTPHDLADHLSE